MAADYIGNKTRINMSFYPIAIQLSAKPEERQFYSDYLNRAYASELGQMVEVNQARGILLKDIGEALILFPPSAELNDLTRKANEALHDLVMPTRPPQASIDEAKAWNKTVETALNDALHDREDKVASLARYLREQYLSQGE